MKNILLIIVLLLSSSLLCFACGVNIECEDYLRIHIRANSNTSVDQNIKYIVKDVVVEYLTPYIVECSSLDEVKVVIESNSLNIKNAVDEVLKNNGFEYLSEVKINKEFFPTRSYENLTLESNFYDAIIINLGSGDGDNWWCVVYPPLCFKDVNNVVYKSKIMEIISQMF